MWPRTSRPGSRRRRRRRPQRFARAGRSRRRRRAARAGPRICCGPRGSWLAGRSRWAWSRPRQVLLHPSVIERFTAHAPGLSGPARRDAAHQPAVHRPARGAAPGPGGRAAAPGARPRRRTATAEIAGFLALADAQPTLARRMRVGRDGMRGRWRRADPRRTCGACAAPTSPAGPAGSSWQVRGRRPRAVPVLARYHDALLAVGSVRRRSPAHRRDRPGAARTSPTR